MEKLPSRLFTSLLAGLMTINVSLAADASRPKLIVGIVVDQLRTDYVEYLQNLMGEAGFKKMMKDGLYVTNVDFKGDLKDPVSATALLYTGNYPRANGIGAAEVYSPAEHRMIPALSDKKSLGISTSEALSPANILLSTLSDEVMIDGDGLTSIYSISTDPQQAIIMAGHAGSGAFWINDVDGKWSSTAYYRNYPDFINRRNRLHPLLARVDTMQWRPSRKIEEYPGIPAQKRVYPFRYTFPRADKNLFARFKSSALANAEVTDVALEAISNLGLGKRGDAIDMLSIGYTAAPFGYVGDGDARVELEDTYLRLDAQLARLFSAIDREVGLGNTLIFLSSTGYYTDGAMADPKFRIPTGDVSLKRVQSLLNSYLSAKYGNADYILAIASGQVHLDTDKIEQRGNDPRRVLDDARDFLLKMSGISDVATLSDIIADKSEEGLRKYNSIDPKNCGNLFITFTPGWNVVDDLHYPTTTTPVRTAMVASPFMMMGPGVVPRKIDTPVDATAIAPTISSTLHIRSPNGAKSRPL